MTCISENDRYDRWVCIERGRILAVQLGKNVIHNRCPLCHQWPWSKRGVRRLKFHSNLNFAILTPLNERVRYTRHYLCQFYIIWLAILHVCRFQLLWRNQSFQNVYEDFQHFTLFQMLKITYTQVLVVLSHDFVLYQRIKITLLMVLNTCSVTSASLHRICYRLVSIKFYWYCLYRNVVISSSSSWVLILPSPAW